MEKGAFNPPAEAAKSSADLPKRTGHDLQFYDEIVTGSLPLVQLERLSLERLLVLGTVLKIGTKNDGKTQRECLQDLVREMRKRDFKTFADLVEGCGDDTPERRNARKMDNVSHNILGMIFSNDLSAREWFLQMESLLFSWRLWALDERAIFSFRKINNMRYPTVGEEEKKRLSIHLEPLVEKGALEKTKFYRVSVFEVLDLVENKNVFFQNGIAYVTELQLRSLIQLHFQRRLRTRIQKSAGAIFYTNGDERINILGKEILRIYETLKPTISRPEGVSIENLDELAKISHPPCMRKLHEAAKLNNHLRNGGRVQYTLFLKSIGISANDAFEFFEKLFTKKMSKETFRKEYFYQFRHMYGQVGAKKNYQLKNCLDIAKYHIAGIEEYHGCFFATEDIEDLGKKLDSWNVRETYKTKICESTKFGECGKACSAYFEASHGSAPVLPIVTPIDFFEQSMKIRRGKNNENSPGQGKTLEKFDDLEDDDSDELTEVA